MIVLLLSYLVLRVGVLESKVDLRDLYTMLWTKKAPASPEETLYDMLCKVGKITPMFVSLCVC
jgi:hypothetical protein